MFRYLGLLGFLCFSVASCQIDSTDLANTQSLNQSLPNQTSQQKKQDSNFTPFAYMHDFKLANYEIIANSLMGNVSGIINNGNDVFYFTDHTNHVIWKLDENNKLFVYSGNLIPGNQNGDLHTASFNYPIDLTINDDNDIFVVDKLNKSIRKITSLGLVVTYSGGEELGLCSDNINANYENLISISYLENDNSIYIAEYNTISHISYISKIHLSTAVKDACYISVPGKIGSLIANDLNNKIVFDLIVDDSDDIAIYSVESNDNFFFNNKSLMISTSSNLLNNNNIGGLAYDINGQLFFAGGDENLVFSLDNFNNIQSAINPSFIFNDELQTFRNISSIAFDSNNNMLITDELNSRIVKISPSLKIITE